jgi:hypothetical protein
MIISKEIEVTVNYLNIDHFKSLGFDVGLNRKIIVKVENLPSQSNKKIQVKCDLCGKEKFLSYQKYNKNISKYNLYCCNTSCSQVKNKMTLKIIYGSENFNRSEENKLKLKEKYDLITTEIEKIGSIICSNCKKENDLSYYTKNINGRYKKVCRHCRTLKTVQDRRNRDMKLFYKEFYKKNIHLFAWRNLLKNYLNRRGIIKNDKTQNILGYSSDELKYHLESLFTSDMSWSNYGKYWQIDHIIPVSLFKEDTPATIVNCLKNLRPLEKFENNSKSNKLDESSISIIDDFKQYLKK